MRITNSLSEWIARDAVAFALDEPASLNAAVDRMVGALGDSVELLGFGEAIHGSEEVLQFRNRLFERLVVAHGYSAIAVESSFPRGRLVNEFVLGRGPSTFDEIAERGFSHDFGRLAANRELVEWMRAYNANVAHRVKVRFYGFDSPTEMMGTESPRQLIEFALGYLESVDAASAAARRGRIEPLLGKDMDWENPAAMFDPARSNGLSPEANALRIEVDDLLCELRTRRPEFVRGQANSASAPPLAPPQSGEGEGADVTEDQDRYLEAEQYASMARLFLNYHAGLARASENRIAELLGIRDLMMADCLVRTVERERGRGKVLAFAHNSHLKCGQAQWQLGPQLLQWWPAGAQLREMLGPRYAVIGSGLGESEANGIGAPEGGALEALLTASPGPARFIPTRGGQGLPAAEIAALPTRTGSVKNQTYFPLTPQCFTEYDALMVLDSTSYNRGGPVLP